LIAPLSVTTPVTTPAELRQQILALTREYSRQVHAGFRPAADSERAPWQEGTTIPYAGRVFTEDEVEAAVSSTLDFWLTLGPEGEAFQKELAAFLGVRHSLLVNSGSSANLIAISALTSSKLPEERRIKPGDEVITVAAGFPTTVAPIVQVGAVPVFIDADPVTGNARCDQLELAYSPGKTKAVMMAHALGNPFDLAATLAFCRSHNLWLVEDNCDALGCSYSMPRQLAESLGFSENSPGLDEGPDRVIRWTGTCDRRELPRLGPRLLVPQRHRQHLQQALRLAAG
jgi:CDP-6-deoxy-D-xylo-4-hexulose-3-dehydrase